jgi:pimeloyl-ACP methyl ester carboxylesterase
MSIWAFVIPGLAMMANEFSPAPGVVVLENPEIGPGVKLEREYTLEDVAEIHIRTILDKLAKQKHEGHLTLYGFSMGGMVLSVIATKYRDKLPPDTRFVFVATTANAPDLPAIPDEVLQSWAKVKPGDEAGFTRILLPFFSSGFASKHPEVVDAYVKYRMSGKNNQSPKAYFRQVSALRSFDGTRYFSKLNPTESIFVVPEDDQFLGPKQAERLRALSPQSKFVSLPNVGHFVNIEAQNGAHDLSFYRLDEIFGKNIKSCGDALAGVK